MAHRPKAHLVFARAPGSTLLEVEHEGIVVRQPPFTTDSQDGPCFPLQPPVDRDVVNASDARKTVRKASRFGAEPQPGERLLQLPAASHGPCTLGAFQAVVPVAAPHERAMFGQTRHKIRESRLSLGGVVAANPGMLRPGGPPRQDRAAEGGAFDDRKAARRVRIGQSENCGSGPDARPAPGTDDALNCPVALISLKIKCRMHLCQQPYVALLPCHEVPMI